MKILITGVTGFIGSHLKKELDGKIYGLVHWSHRKEKHEGYTPVHGDLRDFHSIVDVIKRIRPDIVFHLGAITPVSLSFERPFDYLDINITGTVNLAEALLRFDPYLKKFIVASTPEVYGIQTQFPIKEDAPMFPNSPYAVSKAAADMYLLYMFRANGFPVVFSRHANCFGRKDQTHFVIEAITTQMLKGKDANLGNPDPVRDFIYVDDAVAFYKALMERGKPGEIYNFGWGKGYSIRETAQMLKNLTGFTGKITWNTLPTRQGEIPKIELDSTKARVDLGISPQVTFEEGLRRSVQHWSKKLL